VHCSLFSTQQDEILFDSVLSIEWLLPEAMKVDCVEDDVFRLRVEHFLRHEILNLSLCLVRDVIINFVPTLPRVLIVWQRDAICLIPVANLLPKSSFEARFGQRKNCTSEIQILWMIRTEPLQLFYDFLIVGVGEGFQKLINLMV